MSDSEYPVARFDDLVPGVPAYVAEAGLELCVVRVGEAVHVIGDVCTHQEVSLSEGEVDLDTCHVECWKHGSSFSLLTGQPDALPATRPVAVYPVRLEAGEVLVTLPNPEEDRS